MLKSKSIRPIRRPVLTIFLLLLGFSITFAGSSTSLHAEERAAYIFQDNMVLQRDKPVPIWGIGTAGAQVEVSFNGQKKQTQVDEHGAWKVTLDPMKANKDGQDLGIKIGSTTADLKNVLVGEVWIAAGQSNMVAPGPDDDTGVYPHYVSPGTQGGKPEIRYSKFGWGVSMEPEADLDPAGSKTATWKALEENPPAHSMAMWEYFSRVLRDGVDVPVGIVEVAVAGTPQTAWMSKEALEKFPGEGGTYYQEVLGKKNADLAKLAGPYASWDAFQQADAEWRKNPQGKWPGDGWAGNGASWLEYASFPTVLYNTRIHPLAPFAIRGLIWHQGEAGPGGPYGDRLVAMIKQWRELFGQDFYFVCGTLGRSTSEPPPLSPGCTSFYRSITDMMIRPAVLTSFGDDKNEALAELYDLGYYDTHFLEKAEAGRRMAQAALTLAYGQNLIYSGPQIAESKIEGNKATIRFNLVGDGLVYQPSLDGISSFYLADKSGQGKWGQVKVVGKDTIEVSSPDITDLAMVSYANNTNPHETLFNSAGLPASPFVINPIQTHDAKPPIQLVTLQGPAGEKVDAILHVPHVRREGYVFQPKPQKHSTSAPTTVQVQAYIPAEWKGYEVEAGGKPLEVTETTQNGVKFVTFTAVLDDTWVIVAEKGKAEGLRKVNRF